ncbi:hypothetical protein NP493_581g00008 [Ridgeia piscesae]|uniref:Small ribosomal subunit protein uS10 domain-containing protein n=1 Tax=Ridgeia piscesae TaxID=27915 RepID=A0AAD9NR71_RIDPI|nr:hypothetical protein NP493_581g00008 [Ridgeia piscesae]
MVSEFYFPRQQGVGCCPPKQEPEIPEYEELNIRLRGYDFTVLESFMKYVHNMADVLDISADAWPVPARTTTVRTFKPFSTKTLHEYNLSLYERVVQIQDVPATMVPLFLEVVQQNLPEGVSMAACEPETEEDKYRYVPDVILEELETQLEELDKAKEERKK